MAPTTSRRTFLQVTAAGTTLAVAPAVLPRLPALSGEPPAGQVNPARSTPGKQTKVLSACEMCTVRCPIVVRVRDGEVVRIEGNPKEKATHGAICARGNAGISLLRDPDRVRTPLIRVGERGEGKFRQASWEEAYRFIAERLTQVKQRYGPQALAMARRPSATDPFLVTFGKAFGTPNLFTHESTCPMARNVALEVSYGTAGVAIDYGKLDYLVSFGRNHFETIAVPQAQGLVGALGRGAQLVYVDPRHTPTAAAATTWLQIRPGTDLALVLAMLHVLIAEGLYDHDFVQRYTHGFAELAEAVKECTPDWAAKQTGIPAAKIREVAGAFGLARPRAVADFGWYTAGYANEFQLRRAIIALNALAGNLEVPGGTFLIKGMKKYAAELGSWKKPKFPKASAPRVDGAGVPGRFPLAPAKDGLIQALPDAIITGQPYPVRAFIASRFDPLAAVPDQARMIEAFGRLDLLVSIDVYVSDTGAYADVVLPECTYLERTDPVFDVSGLVPKIRYRQQAVPPQGEARPGWRIYKELAEATGIGEYFGYRDIDEVIAAQLAPLGVSPQQLAASGQWAPPGFAPLYLRGKDPTAAVKLPTASGKIELASEELAGLGIEPVPRYRPPAQRPPDRFRLVQGKCAVHTNSATANVPWLHELRPDNELWIHPTPAARLGIRDGDRVVVRAGGHQQHGKAKVTDGISEDTVFAYHGWGRLSPGLTRVRGRGISGNALLPATTDPVTGSLIMRETFVEVVKS